jgi:hypothetical protein
MLSYELTPPPSGDSSSGGLVLRGTARMNLRRTTAAYGIAVAVITVSIVAGCGRFRQTAAVYREGPDTLVYRGGLSKAANEQIFKLYEEAQLKPRLLKVTSGGGDVHLGMDLGEWVFRNALNVEVVDHCFSSCANYVFTAGKTKLLNSDAVLFWHGGAYQPDLELQLKDAGEAGAAFLSALRTREDSFFRMIGVNQAVTTYGQTAPHVVRPPNTAGWDLSIEGMAKLGITNIVEKGGPWRWRELRPEYQAMVFRLEVR